MTDFYVDTLNKLLKQGLLRTDHKVLVVCGNDFDQRALEKCGFQNVTISNVDRNEDRHRYAPYDWAALDAEDLACGDDEYDVCIAHSGLHHCRSPHRALLEMYRVARLGLIVFEPLDNAVTRLGVRLGLGQDYEFAAVAGNECECGGLRNTPIPNYVYRWTTRDIEKTICTNAPIGQHRFLYFYATRLNWLRTEIMRGGLLRTVFKLLSPCLKVFSWVFPRQSNNFAFAVWKPRLPEELYPWLEWEEGRVQLNASWMRQEFSPTRQRAAQGVGP